jgi:hypothetical protein
MTLTLISDGRFKKLRELQDYLMLKNMDSMMLLSTIQAMHVSKVESNNCFFDVDVQFAFVIQTYIVLDVVIEYTNTYQQSCFRKIPKTVPFIAVNYSDCDKWFRFFNNNYKF